MKPSRKQYTPEFKREVVALVIEQGHGYSEALFLLPTPQYAGMDVQ